MEGLAIGRAADGDLPGLLALYAQLNPDDAVLTPAAAAAAWRRLAEASGTTVLVARMGAAVLGTATLTIVPNLTRGGRGYALIENVVTDAGARRRGVGRAVLAEAVRLAAEAGCYKVMLATGSREQETLRFYEGAGFAQGTKTHFEVKLGRLS